MATKIYSANVFVGDLENPVVLEQMVVKKLPLYILLNDEGFVQKLIKYVGEKQWKELIPKKQKYPTIKIHYIKQIGTVNQEPIIENYELDQFRS